MSEIDFAQLDKEITKVMAKENKKATTETPERPAVREPVKPRGRYMDIVHPSSDMRIEPEPTRTRRFAAGQDVVMVPKRPTMIVESIRSETIVARHEDPEEEDIFEEEPEKELEPDDFEFGEIEDVQRESGAAQRAAAEDFVSSPEPMQEDFGEFVDAFNALDDEVPNANNYSLGGRSPFIPDAKVEKRPLGSFVPENTPRGIQSTRNTYSQRTPVREEKEPIRPMVVEPKKKSGWVWAIITLGVIAAGGGIGWLIYILVI